MLLRNELVDINYNCELTSLSPSDVSIHLSNLQTSKLIPDIKSEQRRLPSIKPNNAAIVLWLEINGKRILLGSDMEVGTIDGTGWMAILESDSRPKGNASIYKVAHHGSHKSDHSRIWDEMLIDNPLAILTPFTLGSIKLPQKSDVERILATTDYCYITSEPKKKNVKIANKIDKAMASAAIKRTLVHSGFGQIRLKSDINSNQNEWRTELINDAKKLKHARLN